MNFAVVRLHPQAPAAATSITQTGVYAGGCLGPLALGALAGRRRLPGDVAGRRDGHAGPRPPALMLPGSTGVADAGAARR